MRGPVADLSGYVPSPVERAHHAKSPDQVQEISLQDHPNTSNLCRYATLQTGSIDECKRKPNQYEEARKIDFHETLFNSTFFKRYWFYLIVLMPYFDFNINYIQICKIYYKSFKIYRSFSSTVYYSKLNKIIDAYDIFKISTFKQLQLRYQVRFYIAEKSFLSAVIYFFGLCLEKSIDESTWFGVLAWFVR